MAKFCGTLITEPAKLCIIILNVMITQSRYTLRRNMMFRGIRPSLRRPAHCCCGSGNQCAERYNFANQWVCTQY